VAFTKAFEYSRAGSFSEHVCASAQHRPRISILNKRHSLVPSSRLLDTSCVYPTQYTLGFSLTDVKMASPSQKGPCKWWQMASAYEAEPTAYIIVSSPELTQASPSTVCPRRPQRHCCSCGQRYNRLLSTSIRAAHVTIRLICLNRKRGQLAICLSKTT